MPVRDFSNYFAAIKNTAEQPREQKPRVSFTIENLFKPTFKNGKAEVVMRFLPSHPNEFNPFIENRSHIYEFEDKKFFGCECLAKYGQLCPICEYNHKLYTCGKFTKDEARPLRLPNARRKFVSNVYIVKNDNNPDSEGKVYRFEYGVQIMDMIRAAADGYDDPEEGHQEGFNPFDYKSGANFIYNGVQGAMGPNITKSKFGHRKPISDKKGRALTDKEIEEIEAQLYTLQEYEQKLENAPSFDDITKRFEQKTGRKLFEIFKGTKEEVPETAANTASTTTTKTAANAAAAVTEAVEDATDVATDVAGDDIPAEQGSFFDGLAASLQQE